jgi:DeoR/GlpR family transcriptional regulator of sugar metabolism
MNTTRKDRDVPRKPADWMGPAHDRILEALREDGNLTPRALSREADINRVDIRRDYSGDCLRELAKAGLVDQIGRGLYSINEAGKQYLDGDLDASELDPTDSTDS